MRVLVACEFSGVVADEFIKAGCEAVSCDLKPRRTAGPHIQGNVVDFLDDGWDMLVGFPPCTFLSAAGLHHLYSRKTGINVERMKRVREACALFSRLLESGIPRIALENPVPHRYARELMGDYSQVVYPWQHGHRETKQTCLWLRGLPLLQPTKIMCPPYVRWVDTLPQSKGRQEKRTLTFSGIAKAMARQWSGKQKAVVYDDRQQLGFVLQ